MTTATHSGPTGQGAVRCARGHVVSQWIRSAWRRLGWRHVLLAMVLEFVAVAFAPDGGAWLHVGRRGPDDPFLEVLSGRWVVSVLPAIFAAMVGDEACDAGVRPFVAHGCALAVCATLLPALDPAFAHLVGMRSSGSLFNPFLFIQLILEGGLFMAAWGYWHVTERTLALTQTAEAERVRDQQHLFNARLLTLQARVEPQFLFDALSQVRATHERDKGLADALLTDMITLLRVMLPIASASTSTVEREFGLVGAWVRVQRQLGGCAELNIVSPGEAATSPVGAMLVLPMLRTAIDASKASAGAWRLAADLASGADPASRQRLRISLTSVAGRPDTSVAEASADLSALRERVMQLYGSRGAIAWIASGDRRELVLDLPLMTEDSP